MELHYGIHQPLRFYENLQHQNRFRDGTDSFEYELLVPKDRFLPFQIKRISGDLTFPLGITSIKLVNLEDEGTEIEILADMPAGQIERFTFDQYDYFVYYGSVDHALNLAPGRYYLIIQDQNGQTNSTTWYSEVMTVKDINQDTLNGQCIPSKVTYWDTCDIADIFYRTLEFGGAEQYKNILYLSEDISKPNYDHTDQGDEDNIGTPQIDYKRLEKEYFIQGAFPEFMVDALNMLPLHVNLSGFVEVLTERGYLGVIDQIATQTDWQDTWGNIALVDLVFSTRFIVKSNCCGDLEKPITSCIIQFISAVGRVEEGSDDWQDSQYRKADDNSIVDLVAGDNILVETAGGIVQLKTWTGANYQNFPLSLPGIQVVDINQLENGNGTVNAYYFYSGSMAEGLFEEPVISNVVDNGPDQTIFGTVWGESTISIIAVLDDDTTAVIVENLLGAVFNNLGQGYTVTLPGNTLKLYIVAQGLNCILGQSEDYILVNTGIGVMGIENDFIVG